MRIRDRLNNDVPENKENTDTSEIRREVEHNKTIEKTDTSSFGRDRKCDKGKDRKNQMKWKKSEPKEVQVNKAECKVVVFGDSKAFIRSLA